MYPPGFQTWVDVTDARRDRVILYLHGGGFTIGNFDTHDSLCRQLALRADETVRRACLESGEGEKDPGKGKRKNYQ